MNATELRRALERLDQTEDELADHLDVSADTVRAWTAGRTSVPRRRAQQIEWLAAMADRNAALRASGLPECDWIRTNVDELLTDDGNAAATKLEEALRHAESCRICIERDRFVAERFGSVAPMPQTGWLRAIEWYERIPAWARPAALGAALLGIVVSMRVVFALPFMYSDPARFGEALLAVAAAAGAGAVGGFAYTLTRPTLGRLGRPGDYLTGIACVIAYMGALALVAPVAFGDPIIEDAESLTIFGVLSVFFGLVVGHFWFRGESAGSA